MSLDELNQPPLWFQTFQHHIDGRLTSIDKAVGSSLKDTKNNTERLIKIETKIEAYEKDLNRLGEKNNTQHIEFYGHINSTEKHQDLKIAVKENETRSEQNEKDIISYKSSIRTIYIVFGVVVAIISALYKLGVI